MICAVAGMTADANILINYARQAAQRYLLTYNEDIPCEQLVRRLCDLKQGYTQHGGLRPFGVSFIYAGWDPQRQFQLYLSNPSGNYGGWKATSSGANHASAQSLLKQDYKEDCTLKEACGMAVKVLSKTMDSTKLSSEKSGCHISYLQARQQADNSNSRVRNGGPDQGRQDLPQTMERRRDHGVIEGARFGQGRDNGREVGRARHLDGTNGTGNKGWGIRTACERCVVTIEGRCICPAEPELHAFKVPFAQTRNCQTAKLKPYHVPACPTYPNSKHLAN